MIVGIQVLVFGVLSAALGVPNEPSVQDTFSVEVIATARLLEKEGQVVQARQILRDALRKHPKAPALWHALGESMLSDDPRVSRVCALRVLKLHSESRKGLDLLTAAFARSRVSGLRHEAEVEQRRLEINDYKAVLRLNPEWPEALYRSASQRLALERLLPLEAEQERRMELDQSIQELKQAVKMLATSPQSPLRSGAHFQLGRAYKHRADTGRRLGWDPKSIASDERRAIKELERSAEIDPKRIDAIGEIVLIHGTHGKHDQALAVVEAHLPHVSDQAVKAKLIEMRAQALADVGRIDEARTTFERAIAMHPQLMGSYLNLARLHETQGALEKSQEVLRSSVRVEPLRLSGRCTSRRTTPSSQACIPRSTSTAIVSITWQPLRWRGFMSTMQVTRSAPCARSRRPSDTARPTPI